MAIKIHDDKRKLLIPSIKRFFDEHLDEDVGDLKAMLVLDYFLTEIGPTVYNRAVADAQAYFQEKIGDLEGACYEPEMGFWKKGRSRD